MCKNFQICSTNLSTEKKIDIYSSFERMNSFVNLCRAHREHHFSHTKIRIRLKKRLKVILCRRVWLRLRFIINSNSPEKMIEGHNTQICVASDCDLLEISKFQSDTTSTCVDHVTGSPHQLTHFSFFLVS